MDLETQQSYQALKGIKMTFGISELERESKLFSVIGGRTFVKEIPNTKLLVSLNLLERTSTNMAIFDISRESKPCRIYCFEEVCGSNLNKLNLHIDDSLCL